MTQPNRARGVSSCQAETSIQQILNRGFLIPKGIRDMGVRRGGQEGGLAPLGWPKWYVFRLFERKQYVQGHFLGKQYVYNIVDLILKFGDPQISRDPQFENRWSSIHFPDLQKSVFHTSIKCRRGWRSDCISLTQLSHRDEGSISPTFYEQLLQAHIPKAH